MATPTKPTDEWPTHAAGCRMPTIEGIDRMERICRTQAELDNISFLTALKRYFDNGGRG